MGMFVVAPAASFNHHHHHQHDSHINLATADPIGGSNPATALGVGVIPLLTAAPCLPPQNVSNQDLLNNGRNKISNIQFWQNQNQYNIRKVNGSLHDYNNCSSNLLQSGSNTGCSSGGGGSIGGNSTSSGSTTCQDCGNQAKKDCSYRRCRTCCKSRGYHCATHVKSTWVPAARRRERQLMVSAAGVGVGAGSSESNSGIKKPRLINSQTTTTSHTSTSNTTTRSFDTSSSQQDGSCKKALPGQVRAPAVFKCVRVTAMDDGEDEYAYQAEVKIGGHVFKGFLYDQGEEARVGFPNLSELHLGGATSGSGVGGHDDGCGRNYGSSSSPIVDPSDVFGASGGGFPSYGNP